MDFSSLEVHHDMSYVLDQNKAVTEATEQGLDIVYANDLTLQLDFDSDEDYEEFLGKIKGLAGFIDVRGITFTVSRSGNKHVYINLAEPLPPYARVALQAGLGSDKIREYLSALRIVKGLPNPILLFERPNTVHTKLF